MLTFTYWWAFLLLPLPFLVKRFASARQRSRPAVRVPFFSRLVTAKGGSTASAGLSSVGDRILKVLLWCLVVIALAKPQWLEPPIERVLPTRDLMLLVDLSASMDHEDFENEDGKMVNRLTALKQVLGEFLLQRKGDRVGLVVFGNSPFLQVPFSIDLELSKSLLDETEVGMAGPRTALGDAIGLGIKLFENSDAPAKTIIALTDGNDTASAVPPTEAAGVAADREITIHTIAMGDPTSVGEQKIDEEELRNVARVTGGEFFLAMDRDALTKTYETLDKIETKQVKTASYRPRRELYYFVIAIGFALSLLNQVVKLVRFSSETGKGSGMRLRVNPRNFELETTDS